jgi:hypothetical protein
VGTYPRKCRVTGDDRSPLVATWTFVATFSLSPKTQVDDPDGGDRGPRIAPSLTRLKLIGHTMSMAAAFLARYLFSHHVEDRLLPSYIPSVTSSM